MIVIIVTGLRLLIHDIKRKMVILGYNDQDVLSENLHKLKI